MKTHSLFLALALGSLVNALAQPLIHTQPSSQTVVQGATVNFNVGASGGAPLSYQWRRAGLPLSGATFPNYTIENVQASHAGLYSVLVANGSGSVLSSNALLTVLPCVIISCPAKIVANCSSQTGTVINISITTSNLCSSSAVTKVCEPPLNTPFPPGMTTVNCRAYSLVGTNLQTNHCSFPVTILDTCAPANCVRIVCPSDMKFDCSSPTGTVVRFNVSATNLCSPNPIITYCTPASGTPFAIGTTPVDCHGISQVGTNRVETSHCRFHVTVEGNCAARSCFAVASEQTGPRLNPWEPPGFKFERFTAGGVPSGNNEIATAGAFSGLSFDQRLEIELGTPCTEVTLDVLLSGSHLDATAYDASGIPVDAAVFVSGETGGVAETLTLRSYGTPIKRVRLITPARPVLLLSLCCRTVQFHYVFETEFCHAFDTLPPGPVNNNQFYPEAGLTLRSWLLNGTPDPETRIDTTEAWRGYHVQYQTTIEFAMPSRRVTIEFFQMSGLVEFKALDDAGAEVVLPRMHFEGPGMPPTLGQPFPPGG